MATLYVDTNRPDSLCRLAASAQADKVDDLRYAWGLQGNRFGHQPLVIGIDQAVQIHYMVQRLHLQQVRSLQGGMLSEQRSYPGRNIGILGATAEPAFSVGRATLKNTGQKDGEGQCRRIESSPHFDRMLLLESRSQLDAGRRETFISPAI